MSDLHDLEIDAALIDNINSAVEALMCEVWRTKIERGYSYLPVEWAPRSDGMSGEAVTDADMIYTIGNNCEDDAFVISRETLSSMIDGMIELNEVAGGKVDPKCAPYLSRLADALDRNAAKLRSALPEHTP